MLIHYNDGTSPESFNNLAAILDAVARLHALEPVARVQLRKDVPGGSNCWKLDITFETANPYHVGWDVTDPMDPTVHLETHGLEMDFRATVVPKISAVGAKALWQLTQDPNFTSLDINFT
jgi:hypothetical protein